MAIFQSFSVQGTRDIPTGPDLENRVGDQDTGSPGKPVCFGLQVPGEPEHYRARTRPPWWTSRGVFLSKRPSIAPAEVSNTPLWYFGPLEDNQWGGCRLDPTKSRREIFQRIFALGIFWGSVSRYAANPLIVALSPGHSDITRFFHGHQSWQEIIWIAPKKIPNLFRRLAPLTFLIRVQAFRYPLRGELPHVQIFMNDGPNPLTWDTQLLSYWFSPESGSLPRLAREFDQWTPEWSMFCVVQDEAHHRWKNHHV